MKKTLSITIVVMLAFSTFVVLSPIARADDKTGPPCLQDTTIQNEYLMIAVGDPPDPYAARFTLGNTGGDPTNPNDDNRILLFGHPYPWSSFTTVRIDGSDFIYGDSVGTFTENPTSYLTYIKTVWVVASVQVTQVLALTLNPSTDRVDAMEIRYMLENLDLSNSHNIGLRILLDTMLGSNDGSPFQVPGTGAVTTEREYAGVAIPDYWQSFDDLNNPTVISQGTLDGGDATLPDRVIFVSWPDFYFTTWDYTITPDKIFGSTSYPDSAVGLYWNPKTLGAGQRIEYVTYYGLSGLSQSMLPPLTLSVSGPLSLSVVSGAYTPNPFTVSAYVQDVSTGVINNVAITINLPTGLSLAGSPATQTIPSLNPNEVRLVSWSIMAADQTTDTLLSYSVEAIATGVTQRTVIRSILIPALSLAYDTTFRSNPSGYQFPNFAVTDLSWDFFRNTYGSDEVEISGQRRPTATSFYDNSYRYTAQGGSCFGMSASSSVLFQNSLLGWNLGSHRTRPLDNIGEPFTDTNGNGRYDSGEPFTDTNGNGVWDSVQTWGVFPSFIASPTDWVEYYHPRQLDAACQADRQLYKGPNTVYNELKQRMASGNWKQDPMVVDIWWPHAGHTVVPTRIEESADHTQGTVFIYDNNFPNEEHSIQFDLTANTARDADYNGGNALTQVTAVTLSAIQLEPQMRKYESVSSTGHLLYTDSSGNQLGFVNGEFISGILGAYLVEITDQDFSSFPETYFVSGLDLERELHGITDGIATVIIMLPDGLAVLETQVTPSSVDEIQVSPDGLTFEFLSHSGTSIVSIMLEVENNELARLIHLSGFDLEAESSVAIHFSDDFSTVSFTNNGVAKAVNLHLEQMGLDPNSYDSPAPIIIAGGSAQIWGFTGSLRSPEASFTEDAHIVTAGTLINFDASSSTDSDGTIASYEWDWESDGTYDSASASPTASHTYLVPGTYTVTLRVTDNDGLTDTATDTKTILPSGVIPEIPLGTVVASGSMIIALLAYIAVPRWRRKRQYINR